MRSPNSPPTILRPRSRSNPPRAAADAPRVDWARVGAFLSLAASLLGLGLAAFLTVLKFLSDCRCTATALTVCHDALARMLPELQDMFDCTAAFSSRWAALLGLPLTLYAAALYATTAALALVAVRGGPDGARAAAWLLAAAGLDVAASALLFAVSSHVLGVWCLFCFCLYFVSAALLAAALIARRTPRAPATPGPGLPVQFAVLFLAVLAVQAVPYASRCEEPGAGRPRPIPPPPETRLVFGADRPDVVVAIFIDPGCSACAHEFVALQALVRDDPGLGVRLYHYPRDIGGCGLDVVLPDTTAGSACDLSFAVECLAERPGAAPGDAVRALAAAFEHRAVRPPSARLATIREQFPPFTDAALARCLDDRRGPLAGRIAAHMRHGAALDIRGTPAVFVAPVRDGEPQWQHARELAGHDERCLRKAIAGARRALSETPDPQGPA